MLRSVIFVSACLSCAFAFADVAPKTSGRDAGTYAAKIAPLVNAAVGYEINVGEPKLPLNRARILSIYAPTDEAPEIASLRADGSLHVSKGITPEEAADVAASQLRTEHSDLCKFASASDVKQAYTVVMTGKDMSWRVGMTVEGGVEFQKPNLTYREINFFHRLSSKLTCTSKQSAKTQ